MLVDTTVIVSDARFYAQVYHIMGSRHFVLFKQIVINTGPKDTLWFSNWTNSVAIKHTLWQSITICAISVLLDPIYWHTSRAGLNKALKEC